MPKKRERSSDEHYRGLLREKDKLIRSLERRIKTLEKQEHLYTQTVEDLVEVIKEENTIHNCPSCKNGILETLDLKYVIYETCNNCGFKEKKTGKN